MKLSALGSNVARRSWWPYVVIAAVIVVWLAPITLLGRMPIGGDVTSFFLPLMSYYRRALLEWRVPLWNELWGFGFPMLAESQAGVFYPPHLILYRLFEVETAYSLNIVLHHVLAGWFAYICGRTFGLRPWGATLAGLVFAGNGFFVIHFPHQWSYTTGCWLPLAVTLAWRAARAEDRGSKIEDRGLRVGGRESSVDEMAARVTATGWRRRARPALGLAAVLAVQMLAGHFQIAFYTQVVVLLIGAWCSLRFVFSKFRRARRRPAAALEPTTQSSILHPRSSLLWVGFPVFASFVLAAVQILPTYELIHIALPEGRDFEYLSGFANTPFHLVSYLLPTLFHVNPLWRPVAWDPFHTSPEECFSYVGLLPICLAAGAAWRWRREPRVRLWVLLVFVTLLLSLGPYLPLFRGLIRLPGFDGFRSASRWGVTTALFLGLLAGRALDGVRAAVRLRFWLRRLVVVTLFAGGLTVAVIVVWIDGAAQRPRWPWTRTVVDGLDQAWAAANPWEDRGLGSARFHAYEPGMDHRTMTGLARIGYRVRANPGEPLPPWPWLPPYRMLTLASELKCLFLQELLPPVVMLGVLWAALYLFPWRRSAPRWLLVALAAVDLGAAAWLRPTEFAPRGRLVQDSAVLKKLSEHAAGQRVSDRNLNLSMIAGAAVEGSYRTVDIPFLSLNHNPNPSVDRRQLYRHVSDRSDTRWEIWTGDLARVQRDHPPHEGDQDEAIHDPLLGRILDGAAYAQAFPSFSSQFVVRHRNVANVSRAWFWDREQDAERLARLLDPELNRMRRPTDLTNGWLVLPPLSPVATARSEPETKSFDLDAANPGALVISDLAYPGWEGRSILANGAVVAAPAIRGGASCLVVQVTQPGKQRVELTFRSRPFDIGLVVSLVAGSAWLVAVLLTTGVRRRPMPVSGST